MIALRTESRISQQLWNRRRFSIDLCGPYACDETDGRSVRCYLQFDRTEVAVDIPAEALRKHREWPEYGEVVLRVPGECSLPVDITPLLTDKQTKTAACWSTEMHDFDRF